MRLMVRGLSWNPFVFQNHSNHIQSCHIVLLTHTIFREISVGFTSTNVWWLLVTSLVSVVCVTGVHYSIKSVNRRPAPEFLKLSDEMVHSIHSLVNGSDMRLNKRQCLDLSSKLSQTIQNIHKLERQCGSSNSVFRPSLEHLYRVLVKARLLVNDCSNENWIRKSVFQIQNESAFEVILMDVGFCYHAIYEQAKLSMSGEWKNVALQDLRASCTFQPASVKDVDEDREELRKRLENLVDARNYGSGWLFQVYYFLLVSLSKKLRLAEYLLVKLHCIAQQSLSDGLQLSKRLLCAEEEFYSRLTWGREVLLGVGAGASGVCKTKWLNVPCAKKCNIPEPYFLKEAGILSHVNYPNIIKFICCGEKREWVEDFIAMELMEMSLSDLIKEKGKTGIPFSYAVAVDIMAQIGRGMCYLHGLRVAHRDLKPANVVLNVLTSPHLECNYHVKLVDFGTSKTQVDPFKTTSTEHGFGTRTHKAPEVRDLAPAQIEGDRKWRAVWFKADVWSFAIICLEVLSLKLRKSLGKEDQDLKLMFPRDCPHELVALLEDCLQLSPRARPDFLEVSSRLEAIRHSLLRRLSSSDQDSLSKMPLDCSHNQFIEMSLQEHFQRQNAGVVADDEEMGVLIPQASHVEPRANQESFRSDTFKLLYDLVSADVADVNPWNKCQLAMYRIDQVPYFTIVEDLEIWTKQPGNEVFRKAVEEWREECKLIAERIRMTEDQEVAVVNQWQFRYLFFAAFMVLMLFAVIYEVYYRRMHYRWVAYWCLVLLVALFNLCLIIYQYRCFWRLRKAVCSDFNKHMVYINRFEMLNQKREFFSFEDDAKEYDPSSNSPPKRTWLLLASVTEVLIYLVGIALITLCMVGILIAPDMKLLELRVEMKFLEAVTESTQSLQISSD